MKDIIIKGNSSKSTQDLLIGSLVIFSSIYLLLQGLNKSNIIYATIGALGIVFFTSRVILAFKFKVLKKPVLLINKEGIIENSKTIGTGLISWDDINVIIINRNSKMNYIEIVLKDATSFSKNLSIIKKLFLKINRTIRNSEIILTLNSVDKEFDEIVELLDKSARQYGKKRLQYRG